MARRRKKRRKRPVEEIVTSSLNPLSTEALRPLQAWNLTGNYSVTSNLKTALLFNFKYAVHCLLYIF